MTKYVMILPDGAADEPIEKLGGRTPLEIAKTPHIDWIASHGQQGIVVTVPDGFSPGSDVASLSLFGYDPRLSYTGRAPLEAAAHGISTTADQLIFRCNFVTIHDGAMVDFTAGHISQEEADRLIADLNAKIGGPTCRFYTGVSYRNLMIASGVGDMAPVCVPPHDIPGERIEKHLPRGPGSAWVREVMSRAHDLLADHEINLVRRDLGENPVSDLWLWGQGRPTSLESFESRFGFRGGVIAAVDLIRGIAKSADMRVIDVPGATGYLDTDYAAKGALAVRALDVLDFIAVHIEAPDEAGHLGDAREKFLALERIDQHIVGPLLEKLRTFDEWRILVAPDHPTPVERRIHTSDPPPFCIAGCGIAPSGGKAFSEQHARESKLVVDPGHQLIRRLIEDNSA